MKTFLVLLLAFFLIQGYADLTSRQKKILRGFRFPPFSSSKNNLPMYKRDTSLDCSWFEESDCFLREKIADCENNCTCIQGFYDCMLENVKVETCDRYSYTSTCTNEREVCPSLECADVFQIEEGICPYVAETSLAGGPPQDINLPDQCSQYSGDTCCTPEDAARLEPTFNLEGSEACQEYVDQLTCVACSPDSWKYYYVVQEDSITITGISICTDYCHKFYDACKDATGSDLFNIGDFTRDAFCQIMKNGLTGNANPESCFDGSDASFFAPSIFLVFAILSQF